MTKLLFGIALMLFLIPQATHGAIVADLGINPTSSQGAFSSDPGGGAFEDQFTFQLVGGPQFLTIGSVTNVFPDATDFITNFQAAVWTVGADGIVNNADDQIVIGPVVTTPCPTVPSCQIASGSAVLDPGNFYLEFTGVGGGTSGYGGNLATFAVPSPILGAGLPGLILLLGGMLGWRRFRG